jgi:tellurite resistance protein TerC
MIDGVSWTWWAGFHAVVILLVIVDSLLTGGHRSEKANQRIALIWTVLLFIASGCFAYAIAIVDGRAWALQWVAGYSIETSLSIDNLFVFLVLFRGFGIDKERQHRALAWGVGGAIVLRAVFIIVGVTLLQHFEWITWFFGLLLLYAAWKLLRGGSAKEVIPEWIRKLQPAKGSLLPVILAIEVTDVLFAVDSIPAVLAVSRHPFIVYTSNIAAILGLRSLYFVLSGLLDRLRYLHYGLGVLLAFVAFKMLVAHWIEIPITVSLGVIAGILGVCAAVSIIAANRDQRSGNGKEN